MSGQLSEKRLRFLLGIFVVLLLAAVVGIGYVLWDYHHSNRFYESLSSHSTSGGAKKEMTERAEESDTARGEERGGGEGKTTEIQAPISVDFDGLMELNPDIVGWIYQEGGKIDYPVVFSGDNDTYLRRMPDKTPATAGSIFLEEKNRPDFEDSHTIIYGHNMRNGSMFGTLKNYRDKDFWEAHKTLWLITPERSLRYLVFAWEEVPGDSFVYRVPFAEGEEFAAFLRQLASVREYDTGIEITDRDRLLTLSTCTENEQRFVVHAVRR